MSVTYYSEGLQSKIRKGKGTTVAEQGFQSPPWWHPIGQGYSSSTELQRHVQSVSTWKCVWMAESGAYIGDWWHRQIPSLRSPVITKTQTPKRKQMFTKSHIVCTKQPRQVDFVLQTYQKNLIGNIPRATFLGIGQRSSMQKVLLKIKKIWATRPAVVSLWCTSIIFFFIFRN